MGNQQPRPPQDGFELLPHDNYENAAASDTSAPSGTTQHPDNDEEAGLLGPTSAVRRRQSFDRLDVDEESQVGLLTHHQHQQARRHRVGHVSLDVDSANGRGLDLPDLLSDDEDDEEKAPDDEYASDDDLGWGLGRRGRRGDLRAGAAMGLLSEWVPKAAIEQLPEELLTHAFEFLSGRELARCAQVSRDWHEVAYDPTLWKHLDLSPFYNRIDDAHLATLISSSRFEQLEFLSLEGCSAVKDLGAVIHSCPSLRTLLLTGCYEMSDESIFLAAHRLPLRKLELFGCTNSYELVDEIVEQHPDLDLGLFWLQYCAVRGLRLDRSGEEDMCRHAQAFNQRGCFGNVRGRVVYSSTFYPRAGNYPVDALFSCRAHAEDDFGDQDYYRCQECQLLFRDESMFSEIVCAVCHDRHVLRGKEPWFQVTRESSRKVNFSNIANKAVHICDPKNLPPSLEHRGTVRSRLNYSFDELDVPNEALDPEQVPMGTFLAGNIGRLREHVTVARSLLREAYDKKHTRALFVYDENEDIAVYSDARSMLPGRHGERYMHMTQQLWHHASAVLYPFVVVMILSAFFVGVLRKQIERDAPRKPPATSLIDEDQQGNEEPSAAIIFLIIAGVMLVFVALLICCIRYRDRCLPWFRRFLVLDVGVIYVLGSFSIVVACVRYYHIAADAVSVYAFCWNYGVVGLVALYFHVPRGLHQFSLTSLNLIMAVMLGFSISWWTALVVLLLISAADLYSELRPHAQVLSPFVFSQMLDLPWETPRILYPVGRLYLRASDMMWYGMLMLSVKLRFVPLYMAFMSGLAGLTITLFVMPFFGSKFRPLPVATGLLLLTLLLSSTVEEFVTKLNPWVYA